MTEAKEPAVARIVQTKQVGLGQLVAYPGNPRRGDVAAIRASLEVTGQYRALVVREDTLEVLAGNHTLAAMRELDFEKALCHLVAVDDEQARRIVLADNRTAELAGYDEQALGVLLAEMDGNLAGTGWDQAAVDKLLASAQPDSTPAVLPETFDVLVSCGSESEQVALLERLSAEGMQCQALLS